MPRTSIREPFHLNARGKLLWDRGVGQSNAEHSDGGIMRISKTPRFLITGTAQDTQRTTPPAATSTGAETPLQDADQDGREDATQDVMRQRGDPLARQSSSLRARLSSIAR